MNDRDYVKFNTSIQTGSNASDIKADANDNIPAVIELRLPANLFGNEGGPKEVDNVMMQTSKLRLSMANTPIAEFPLEERLFTKPENFEMTKCQLDVYPFAFTDEEKLKPTSSDDRALQEYKKHEVIYNIYYCNTDVAEPEFVESFYTIANTNAVFGFPTSSVYYTALAPTLLDLENHHMQMCLAKTDASQSEKDKDKILISSLSVFETAVEDSLANAITYASTKTKNVVNLYFISRTWVEASERTDLLTYYSFNNPVQINRLSLSYNNKATTLYSACFWKYTISQELTDFSCSLSKACKPSVSVGDQSFSIAYDSAIFMDKIPFLWTPSYIDTCEQAPQLTLDTMRNFVWTEKPPKRKYKYGVNVDENDLTYQFSIDESSDCAVMNVLGNKHTKELLSFLPWIKIDMAKYLPLMNETFFTVTKSLSTQLMQVPQSNTEEVVYYTYTNDYGELMFSGSKHFFGPYHYVSAPSTPDIPTGDYFELSFYVDNDKDPSLWENRSSIAVQPTTTSANRYDRVEQMSIVSVPCTSTVILEDEADVEPSLSEREEVLSTFKTSAPQYSDLVNERIVLSDISYDHSYYDYKASEDLETGVQLVACYRHWDPSRNEYTYLLGQKIPDDMTYTTSLPQSMSNIFRWIPPESMHLYTITTAGATRTRYRYFYEYTGNNSTNAPALVVLLSSAKKTKISNIKRVLSSRQQIVETIAKKDVIIDGHEYSPSEILEYIPNIELDDGRYTYLLDCGTISSDISPTELISDNTPSYAITETKTITNQYKLDSITYFDAYGEFQTNAYCIRMQAWNKGEMKVGIPFQELIDRGLITENTFSSANMDKINEAITRGYRFLYISYIISGGEQVQFNYAWYTTDWDTPYPHVVTDRLISEDYKFVVGERHDDSYHNSALAPTVETNTTYLNSDDLTPSTITLPTSYSEPVITYDTTSVPDIRGVAFSSNNASTGLLTYMRVYEWVNDNVTSKYLYILKSSGVVDGLRAYNMSEMSGDITDSTLFDPHGIVQPIIGTHKGYFIIPGSLNETSHTYELTASETVTYNGETCPKYHRLFKVATLLATMPAIQAYYVTRRTTDDKTYTRTKNEITRTISENDPDDSNGYTGNNRLTFTWNGVPTIIMSPISSFVLTLDGVQISHEIQPINIAQPSGGSLIQTVPIIEKYFTASQTIRDLHDELVVVKDQFNSNAGYKLDPLVCTSGRTMTFKACYLTKDGRLHQIYIPRNGVFELQLTFALSTYTSY